MYRYVDRILAQVTKILPPKINTRFLYHKDTYFLPTSFLNKHWHIYAHTPGSCSPGRHDSRSYTHTHTNIWRKSVRTFIHTHIVLSQSRDTISRSYTHINAYIWQIYLNISHIHTFDAISKATYIHLKSDLCI